MSHWLITYQDYHDTPEFDSDGTMVKRRPEWLSDPKTVETGFNPSEFLNQVKGRVILFAVEVWW